MAKAAIPIKEFGNPKTSACSESITLLQFKISEILHAGTNCESLSSAILSTVRRKEARNPDTEPINITVPENDRFARFIFCLL
jgi:hypothetical protein